MRPINITKEELETIYAEEGTIAKVAQKLKISAPTVRKYAKLLNTNIIIISPKDEKYTRLTKSFLQDEYEKLSEISKLAIKLGISTATLGIKLEQFDIKIKHSKYRNRYTVNHNIFSSDTEAAFYLAGFIAADGCILTHKSKVPNVLEITLSSKDIKFLEKVKNLFQFTGPISTKNNNNKYESCTIKIYSKQIIKDLLEKFNITPQKTFTYMFPEKLINNSLIHHFIRGYIDGDGCWYIYPKGSRSLELLGRENILKTINNIIEEKCKLNYNASPKLGINVYRIRYFNKNNNIDKIVEYLYKDATIYLDRKYLKAHNISDAKVANGLLSDLTN